MTASFSETFRFTWSVPEAGFEWRKSAFDSDLHLVRANAERTTAHKRYKPLEEFPALHRIFAFVQEDEESIRRFANLYGNIGSRYGFPVLFLQFPPGMTDGTYGDATLQSWKAEIRAMRALVELWDAIKNQDLDKLKTVISWSENGAVGYKVTRAEGGVSVTLAHPDFEKDRSVLKRLRRGRVLKAARYALREEIDKKIESFPTTLHLVWARGREGGRYDPPPIPDHHLRMVLEPHDLLGAMWLQFAQSVVGPYELRQCAAPGCERYFQAGPGGTRSHAKTCCTACRKRLSRFNKRAKSLC